MTINNRYLNGYARSMRIHISKEQKAAILERFGTVPEPYEWSERDIAVQLQNFLGCGEFVRKAPGDFIQTQATLDGEF